LVVQGADQWRKAKTYRKAYLLDRHVGVRREVSKERKPKWKARSMWIDGS